MSSSDAMRFVQAQVHRVGALPNSEIQSLRERFLAEPELTDLSSLRPVIARSWQRSLACNVTTVAPFLQSPGARADEQLLMAAEPVLTELERLCIDAGGSVVLTDAEGTLAVFRGNAGGAAESGARLSYFGRAHGRGPHRHQLRRHRAGRR